jgi:hypothetical protein
MMSNANLNQGQRAIELLTDLVRIYDRSFPPSEKLCANYETMLLIVDLANLVRRAREAIKCGSDQ